MASGDSAEPSDDAPVAVRVERRRARADEYALVLTAEGLQAQVRGDRDGFAVEVPAAQLEAARRALAIFERENRPVPRAPEPPSLDPYATSHALLVATLLLASFVITGPEGGRFGAPGAAEAAAIRAGAWWRAVTALTLHADAGHVLGNACAGALFLAAVFRCFGPGVGGALVLAAGALGNVANALLRDGAHTTIGASTAVFGALGLIVGERMLRRRASPSRSGAWIPLGAGLALLAMLGTEGERVDVGAHALGLASGIGLGLAFAALPPARLAPLGVQLAAGTGAVALLAIAWHLALAA